MNDDIITRHHNPISFSFLFLKLRNKFFYLFILLPVFLNWCLYFVIQCNKVSGENGAAPELEKEARKCASKVAKETKLIRDLYRQLTQLQTRSTDKVNLRSQFHVCCMAA